MIKTRLRVGKNSLHRQGESSCAKKQHNAIAWKQHLDLARNSFYTPYKGRIKKLEHTSIIDIVQSPHILQHQFPGTVDLGLTNTCMVFAFFLLTTTHEETL